MANSYDALRTGARLALPAARALQGLPGMPNLGPGLGLAQAGLSATNGVRGLPGVAGGLFSAANAAGMLPASVAGAAPLIGPALAVAGAAVNGQPIGEALAASVYPALISMLPNPYGIVMAAPLVAMSIDKMISANNKKIAAERNMHRTEEGAGIMSAVGDAVASGDLNAMIPGLNMRAGDLLVSLAGAAARGDLAAGKDIYEEGVMPSGRYETLAQRLAAAGYKDQGLGVHGPSSGQGKGSVDNLIELIGSTDDVGGHKTSKGGQAYDMFAKWLDSMSEGMPEAFGMDEALNRSGLLRDTPTGGAAFLGARRNELLKAAGQQILPGEEGFQGLSVAAPGAKDIISSYINDPEQVWNNYGVGSAYQDLNFGYDPTKWSQPFQQTLKAAERLGIQTPDFHQMLLSRAQRHGLIGGVPMTDGGAGGGDGSGGGAGSGDGGSGGE